MCVSILSLKKSNSVYTFDLNLGIGSNEFHAISIQKVLGAINRSSEDSLYENFPKKKFNATTMCHSGAWQDKVSFI